MKFINITLLFTLIVSAAQAAGPTSFIYEGQLTDNSGNSIDLATGPDSIVYSIYDSSSCLLYSESSTDGTALGQISHLLGSGTVIFDNSGINTIPVVMNNSALVTGSSCSAAVGSTRQVKVFIPSRSITANIPIQSVPYALQAATLNGFSETGFVQTSANITQPNVESIFSQYTKLNNILTNFNAAGTSLGANITGNAATATTAATATNVTGVVSIVNGGTNATTANAALNNLLPSQVANSGKFLTTDGTNSSWVSGGTGTVTSLGVIVPAYMSSSGGPVTTSGNITLGFGSQTQNLVFASPPGAAGLPTFRAMTPADLPNIPLSAGGTGLSAGGSSNQILGMNNSGTIAEYKTIAAGSNISVVHGANSITINATGSGTVNLVNAGPGLTGGSITNSGTLSVDVGTTANKIVQLDGSARLPLVDGSQLFSLNAGSFSSGVLPVAHGGTGSSFYSLGQIPVSNGTQLNGLGCAAGEILQWSVGPGFVCTSILSAITGFAVLKSGDTMTGSLSVNSSSASPSFTANQTGAGPAAIFTGGRVGIGTATPSVSLDLGNNFDSLRLPSGSVAQRPSSPANGDLRFNSSSVKIEAYEGGSWKDMIKSELPAAAGTAALPGYGFVSASNSGMYNPVGNDLAFSTGGTERLRIISGGKVGIGNSNPLSALDVQGAIYSRTQTTTSTIDWAIGNVQTLSSYSSGIINMSNMQDGGIYKLRVSTISPGTFSFSHPAMTIRIANSSSTGYASSQTYLMSLVRIGSEVFIQIDQYN